MPQAQRGFAADSRSPSGRRAACGVLALLLLSGPLYGQTSGPLTSLGQVRKLTASAGAKALPVKVQATVTYDDPDWRTIFIQDASGAAFLEREASPEDPGNDLQSGQQVEVEGVTTAGLLHCNVKARQIRLLAPGTMPLPIELAGRNAFTDDLEGRWVRVGGWVSRLGNLGNRLTLELVVYPGKSLTMVVPNLDPVTAQGWRGWRVEVLGVFARKVTPEGKATGEHLLFVNRSSDVRQLEELAVRPIGELLQATQRWPGTEPVRIRGRAEPPDRGGRLRVRDRSGSVRVELETAGYTGAESLVEVFGFPLSQGADLVLTQAVASADASAFGVRSRPLDPLRPDPRLPVLDQILQVRDLSAHQAAQGYPVRVHGVVTYHNPARSQQFLQDASAGIYLDLKHNPPGQLPGAGRELEVDGFTAPGDYAPVIHVQHLRDLGPGVFPAAKLTTFETLMSGTDDSQWVSLRGVVRSLTLRNNQGELALSTRQGSVHAVIFEPAGPPPGLIDSVVEVRGVAQTLFNAARRLQGVELLVPTWAQVELKEAAPDDPFKLPVQPINELFEFHAGNSGLHRARLQGQILLGQPDGSFFIQDASAGIIAQLKEPVPGLRPGMAVEVVGFPAVANRAPVLQDCLSKPLAGGAPIQPTVMRAETALDETLQATLVRLEGRVLNQSSRNAEDRLSVQFGPWVTEALLPRRPSNQPLPRIVPGSLVQLTGVCVIRLDESRQVQSFQVLLRAVSDLVVLHRAPWWTARHTVWALAGLGGALLLVLTWVGLLRNQVRQRTGALRAEIEERKRMQVQVEQTHRQLLETSRQAGMAEVATSVLHNVGNVLNSVNVSANLAADLVKRSKVANLGRAVELLKEHTADLGEFVSHHPRGQHLPAYLDQLNQQLVREQAALLAELTSLGQNVEHIKEAVAMQQNYAKVMGVAERVDPAELVEDALRLNAGTLERHQVRVRCEFDAQTPRITVEKHKVLQILVNLIRNAEYACDDSGRSDRSLTLRVEPAPEGVRIEVSDNGVGILPENLPRIFHHGFTTRKHGHGFGLHNGSLTAKELGGRLQVRSSGPGQGASFTLDLPLQPPG